MSEQYTYFGEWLKALSQTHKIQITEIAASIGLKYCTLNRKMIGKTVVTLDNIEGIVQALHNHTGIEKSVFLNDLTKRMIEGEGV
jgi:transcriptional regulator with XRE-family HTH domain